MRKFSRQIALMGRISEIFPDDYGFKIICRSSDEFHCYASGQTNFKLLENLDGLNRKISQPLPGSDSVRAKIDHYLTKDLLIVVEGNLYEDGIKRRLDARTVHLLYDQDATTLTDSFAFESKNWWSSQIVSLADSWLYALFGSNQEVLDFSNYRTNLDLYFRKKDELQENATLSRLIYGLASAYMVTGCNRYLNAAKQGVKYQRDHFKVELGDSCLWAFGKYANKSERIIPSQDGDDRDTIPLYEQIYALSGLSQFYRITQDKEVLEDIRMTVKAFNKLYKDSSSYGGYFSHIDPVDHKYDSVTLGENCKQKNWNSIGDHIPAYLINLVIALGNFNQDDSMKEFLNTCSKILAETTDLIVEKFPEKIPNSNKWQPFVNERFHQDWTPNKSYSWQQDRGIVGHNLKISWNLTRVANYYQDKPDKREEIMEVAERQANAMLENGGIDKFRGGCYDALEREPKNGMSYEFVWFSTKDFWQQEQGILAYLILYGYTKHDKYLWLARELSAFWNLFFLDKERGGVYFRTTDEGHPVVQSGYDIKGGHAISGYHAFELCYLAHFYTHAYVSGENCSFFFRPTFNDSSSSLSLLPDFIMKENIKIKGVYINGIEQELSKEEKENCYVKLDAKYSGSEVRVKFKFPDTSRPTKTNTNNTAQFGSKGKIGLLVESHFDEAEIKYFRDFFPKKGYEIEYISNLWGNDKLEFFGNENCDPLFARKDVGSISPSDYKGIILIGAYAMDRLRYETAPQQGQGNQSPAVRFIRKCCKTANLKIGLICHSHWLMTAAPELLKDKKVTCSHNIIYDVQNAGAEVQFAQDGSGTEAVYVDGNLVTGKHPEVVEKFANTFLEKLKSSQR